MLLATHLRFLSDTESILRQVAEDPVIGSHFPRLAGLARTHEEKQKLKLLMRLSLFHPN